MNDTPFITRPLSIALDLVRALAALAVLVGHAKQLGHYEGPWPFSVLFQHNAVIVFFVLSGLVITSSVDRGGQTLYGYTLARASRILPVALPALLLSLTVVGINSVVADQVYFREDAWGMPTADLVWAVLFLSESYQTGLPINPPYWSLCYEVWFYALFAVATFLSGWTRAIGLAILAAAAGPNVLLMLPVWLVGVFLARLPAARAALPPWLAAGFVGIAVFALYTAPEFARPARLLLSELVFWETGFATYAISDLALATAIGLGFVGLRGLTLNNGGWIDLVERPVRWFANMSFSLYLLHWPLLKVARVLRAPDQGAFGFVVVLCGIIAICGAFAALTEHRRQAFRALLERAAGGRRAGPATA